MRKFFDEYPLNTGRLAAAPIFSDYIENVRIGADETVRVALPSGAKFALLSFDGNVRVKPGTIATTLASPDVMTTDGTGSELNPVVRRLPSFLSDGVTEATHLCVRASSVCTGSISFYA